MAEYNPFTSADENITTSNRALLEAVANAGSAGRKAYEDAAANLRKYQETALARAAERARIIGGPEALETATPARITEALTGLETSKAAFEGGIAATQASNVSYLDKARASIPLLAELNQAKIRGREAEIKGAIATSEAARRAKLEEFLARAEAKETERRARAAKPETFSDSELRTRLRGSAARVAGSAAANLAGPVDFGPARQPKETVQQYLDRLEGKAAERRAATQISATTPEALARQIGEESGVDPNLAAGLFPEKPAKLLTPKAVAAQYRAAAARPSPEISKDLGGSLKASEINAVRATSTYQQVESAVVDDLRKGKSWSQVEADLQGLLIEDRLEAGKAPLTRTLAVLTATFLPYFSRAGRV